MFKIMKIFNIQNSALFLGTNLNVSKFSDIDHVNSLYKGQISYIVFR